MQGFIINLNKVKDEDLIVTIISKNSLDTLYRFYGARHGVINLGFKIDYEKEGSAKSSIERLKDVIHIGYKWINNHEKLRLWQNFLRLFYKHLKDAHEIDDFYFNLLEDASQNWDKQSSKRVAVESYVKLLEYEGRLHTEMECFLCHNKIEGDISLIRAYLPTHKECTHTLQISQHGLKELYEHKSSLFLSNKEVDRLWHILLEGL
ncbi:recombination protein RecO [Sulfurimonas lithotrophica]|uniref:Recombination protein RecO n=1 Tax=Sulfurimonas lithotrophica TaxID=2590022 RepID=A0A5P8P0X7_9BACT|nr:recombination protein RecO [Sulfurimonas lithotrophica]QFR49368.1 recombination protein RecO [Sulfurimonas lithotrophica]